MFFAIKSITNKHWAGICLAVVICLIVGLPPVIWHYSSGYKGIEMMKTNTELHYVSEVQEVYDGYPLLGNPYLSGLKDAPYLFPPFSPNLIALFGKILNVSAIHAVMIFRFIIVGLLAFLIYLFTWQITKSKQAGIVGALFVVLGYGAIVPGQMLAFLRGGSYLPEPSFIDYGRPINPQVGSAIYFAYLCLFWSIISGSENLRKTKILLGGLLIGLAFYTYLFTWTFCIAITATTVVLLFTFKESKQAKDLLIVLAVACIIGIPYLLHSLDVSGSTLYQEVSSRFGFVHVTSPEISRLVIAALILLGVTWRLFSKTEKIFFASVLVSSVVIVNEHLITGLYLFNHHWHWYYITPFIIVLFTAVLYRILNYNNINNVLRLSFTASLVLLFLIGGIFAQVDSYRKSLPAVEREQDYAKLFQWLNNIPESKTIFAPLPIADMIPAVTKHDVYFSGTALYTMVSNKQLEHAYLAYVYLDGVPKKEISNYLKENHGVVINSIFGYACSFGASNIEACSNISYTDYLSNEYNSISDGNFVKYLKKYPIDYIIYDSRINRNPKIQNLKLKMLWTDGPVTVFELPED